MSNAARFWLICLTTSLGVTFAVNSASADDPIPALVTTTTSIASATTSVVNTYDSEADLWVTPIDEDTIEVSRPD